MEQKDCEYNFAYDGTPFDIHINISQYTMKGMFWEPKTENVKGIFIYVHGLNSFLTSERDTATLMTSNGYAFFGSDHIGHGESEGPIVSCTVEEAALETIEVIKKANEVYPGKPVFVMGHSLGGLVVLYLGMWMSNELLSMGVKCIIATAPYISQGAQRPMSWIEKYLVRFANYILPTFTIPIPGGFEPEVPQQYSDYVVQHSKGNGYITPKLLVSCMNEMDKIVNSPEKWPENMPLLFFQGLKDAAVNPTPNLQWAEKVKETHPNTIDIHVYENATHQLTRVEERGDMFRNILEYMNKSTNQ